MKTPSSLDRETFQQLLANAFAVQESQISSQSLAAVMEVQRSMAKGKLDLDGVMRQIVESAQNVANATGVAIALLKTDQLTYRAGIGSSTAYVGRQVTASLTGSAEAKTNREILRVENAQTDTRIEADICRQFGANALLILPIYHEGAVAGVLDVRFNEAHAFDDREIRTYRLMAEQIEAALNRAAQIEYEVERNRNLAAELAPIADAPESIAPLTLEQITAPDEDSVPPPEFMMLPQNEHSLYARCGAVLADIMQLAVFKQSAWLAKTLTQPAKNLAWPRRQRASTLVVARKWPTFKRPTLPTLTHAQRVKILAWPNRLGNSVQASATAFSSALKRTASSASRVAQRAKNVTWPNRLRNTAKAAGTELSSIFRHTASSANVFAQRAKSVTWPNRGRNITQAAGTELSSIFKQTASSATVFAQRAKNVTWPHRWRKPALAAVAVVLAFTTLIAYRGRGPAKALESSSLPSARDADKPAHLPKPSATKGTAARASVPAKQAAPAKNALKRVRVSPNEVDYIGDDVTVRTFNNSSPAKRTRVAAGRSAKIGDDVTVRYFTPSPAVTKTAAR